MVLHFSHWPNRELEPNNDTSLLTVINILPPVTFQGPMIAALCGRNFTGIIFMEPK